LRASLILAVLGAANADAAYKGPGKCIPAEGWANNVYDVTPHNRIQTTRVPCWVALWTVAQIQRGGNPQYTRRVGENFKLTTQGAQWYVDWTCKRTSGPVMTKGGPVYPFQCKARRGRYGRSNTTIRGTVTFRLFA
jgi:hypothetical protein